MKKILSIVALLGLTGLGVNLSAQQTPSTQDPASAQSQPQQTQTDAQNPQATRAFEGKIAKSGDKPQAIAAYRNFLAAHPFAAQRQDVRRALGAR